VYIILKNEGFLTVLQIRIRDRYKVRIRIRDLGSGINNPDHISESLETIFVDKNTLMRIRNGTKSDPG
jgi:hypothetical protein